MKIKAKILDTNHDNFFDRDLKCICGEKPLFKVILEGETSESYLCIDCSNWNRLSNTGDEIEARIGKCDICKSINRSYSLVECRICREQCCQECQKNGKTFDLQVYGRDDDGVGSDNSHFCSLCFTPKIEKLINKFYKDECDHCKYQVLDKIQYIADNKRKQIFSWRNISGIKWWRELRVNLPFDFILDIRFFDDKRYGVSMDCEQFAIDLDFWPINICFWKS